jgi:hypothetical protein
VNPIFEQVEIQKSETVLIPAHPDKVQTFSAIFRFSSENHLLSFAMEAPVERHNPAVQ